WPAPAPPQPADPHGAGHDLVGVLAVEVGEDGLQVGLAERPHRPAGPVLVVVEGPRSRAGHRGAPFRVVLAGGPLRAGPATLLLRSRLAGVLAGRLGLVAAVGGPLLGVDSSDGGSGLLPVGSLCSVGRLRAEGPIRVGDLVGVPVGPDLRGAPAPPGARRCQAKARTTWRYCGPRWALASSQPSRTCWCWRSSRSRSWARLTCWVATANPPSMWLGWSSPRRRKRSMPAGWRPAGCWWVIRVCSACSR